MANKLMIMGEITQNTYIYKLPEGRSISVWGLAIRVIMAKIVKNSQKKYGKAPNFN